MTLPGPETTVRGNSSLTLTSPRSSSPPTPPTSPSLCPECGKYGLAKGHGAQTFTQAFVSKPSHIPMCARYPFRRDFRFDNIWWACLTLFEVLTLEGWLDLRDMFSPGDELTSESSAWVSWRPSMVCWKCQRSEHYLHINMAHLSVHTRHKKWYKKILLLIRVITETGTLNFRKEFET